MAVKSIKFGSDARARIARGVDTLARAVSATLGPRGRNIVIESDYGTPVITKNGVTVARSIDLSNNFEDMGVQMVKQVALVLNRLRGTLQIAAVKSPGFGENRQAVIEDIAILTGGQVISEETGIALDKAELAHCGRAKKVVISKDVVPGGGLALQNAASIAGLLITTETIVADIQEATTAISVSEEY